MEFHGCNIRILSFNCSIHSSDIYLYEWKRERHSSSVFTGGEYPKQYLSSQIITIVLRIKLILDFRRRYLVPCIVLVK
jgi:hypothetical protein